MKGKDNVKTHRLPDEVTVTSHLDIEIGKWNNGKKGSKREVGYAYSIFVRKARLGGGICSSESHAFEAAMAKVNQLETKTETGQPEGGAEIIPMVRKI